MPALSKTRFLAALRQKKIPSILELSRRTGLHRNTINHYLAGQSVYQQGYLKLCEEINTAPQDLVRVAACPDLPDALAQVFDNLSLKYPKLVFILFGSRARLTAKPLSDWDVGFFSSEKISHDQHLKMLSLVDDLCEIQDFKIDLANLNQANDDFLLQNINDFIFLTGSLLEWNHFKERLCKINNSKKPSKISNK